MTACGICPSNSTPGGRRTCTLSLRVLPESRKNHRRAVTRRTCDSRNVWRPDNPRQSGTRMCAVQSPQGHTDALPGSSERARGRSVALFNPRTQKWSRHFTWTVEGLRVEGRTQSGRATVNALNMNHPTIVMARSLWVSLGVHPQPA